MKRKANDIPILDRIISLRKKMGDKKLGDKLAELDDNCPDKDKVADEIVSEVCVILGCENILTSSKKWLHDDRKKNAVNFSVFILKKHLGMAVIDLSARFDFHRSYFYKIQDMMEALNPDNRFDKEILVIYDKVINTLKSKKLISDKV